MPKPAFNVVEKLFHQVVDLPVERRAMYLAEACGDDVELRAAVDELLRHDQASAETSSFLAGPLTQAAADLRPTQPGVPDDPTTPTIPGYHILGSLGRGGMGIVYMARQASLKRIVALKMLLPAAGLAGPGPLARFKSEAELLARIHQPNIVPIHDVGENDGRPYFTMEFVNGPDLAQFLAGRSQSAHASAHLVEILARAIHAVHEVGIVHRDLKPANVLMQLPNRVGKGAQLSPADTLKAATPKITDFGLAKDWNIQSDLTQTGMTLGTPSYMAPEQARNRSAEIGPATDIYSLGAILYEMLTGRPPFDASTPAETIALLLRDDPLPPAQLKAGLPRDLTTICLKCLEKSPRRRYATALELAEDLRLFQAGKPIHARPVGFIDRTVRWCRRHPLSAALSGLCGLLAIAFLITALIYDYQLEAAFAREQALVVRQRQQIVQLNLKIGVVHYDAGDTFAALLRYAEAMRLDDEIAHATHRMRIAALLRECPRLIEVEELQQQIVYARPTTQNIYASIVANDTLVIKDVRTNRIATPAIMDNRNLRSLSLCPEGRKTVRVDHDGTATIVDGKDNSVMTLANGDGPAIIDVTIHRDAAALVSTHADGSKRLWVTTDGQPVARPLPPSTTAFAISDCGKWLLTINADGEGQLSELTGGQSKRPPQFGPGVARAIVSANAERVVTIDKDQSVRAWHVATGESIAIPHHANGEITHAQFSPDGNRLLLADTGGTIRVWHAATARPLTPLLCSAGPIAAADFQGDGHHVVIVGRSGSIRVWELPGVAAAPTGRWDPQCDVHSVDELMSLLQVLAHRRIDEQQWITPLTIDRVRATIERMNSPGNRR